ncbi:MAG: TlpA disulfide reductase family protein [Planctomycetota bacterium]
MDPVPTAAAKTELQRALQFLHALPTASLKMSEEGLDIDLRVAADRFAVMVSREGRVFDQTISDGRRMLSEHWQKHEIGAAPKGFRAWLQAHSGDGGTGSSFFGLVTLQGLWGGAGTDRSLLDAKKVVDRGVESVAGRACTHLSVRDRDLECEIWVQQGDEPWIRRFQPRPDDHGVMDYTSGDMALGDDTQWSRAVPADAFVLKASEESVLVEDLAKELARERAERAVAVEVDTAAEIAETGGPDAVGGAAIVDQQNQPVAAGEAAHPSVGKAAPDVTLTLLDDTTVRLADLKGKVVVLDFWATWCGPCVAGLPKIAEVTKKLADRGVVFYALNLDQTHRMVRRHLRSSKLDVTVSVVEQPIVEAFGVSGVPHTVVIDGAGVIRMVHVGYSPGDEMLLEKALLAALASSPAAAKPGEKSKPDAKVQDAPASGK